MTDIPDRLARRLDQAGVPREERSHRPITSALDAAEVRGTDPRIGGKTLVMKVKGLGLCAVAVRGSDGLDGKAFRKGLGVQRYRFARRDELEAHGGLVPGTIPPFGRPVLDMPLFVDRALVVRPQVVFTPGRADRSWHMATGDWLWAARPAAVWRLAHPRADDEVPPPPLALQELLAQEGLPEDLAPDLIGRLEEGLDLDAVARWLAARVPDGAGGDGALAARVRRAAARAWALEGAYPGG